MFNVYVKDAPEGLLTRRGRPVKHLGDAMIRAAMYSGETLLEIRCTCRDGGERLVDFWPHADTKPGTPYQPWSHK